MSILLETSSDFVLFGNSHFTEVDMSIS
jgi:hypothetical protein